MRNRDLSDEIDLPSIKPIFCGEENCPPGHEFGGIRSYYIIHIIKSGTGEFFSPGSRWSLREGDAFIIFPEKKHLYKADTKKPWSYFWIAFEGNLSGWFNNILISAENPVLTLGNTDNLYSLFKMIYSRIAKKTLSDTLAVSGYFTLILSSISRKRELLNKKYNGTVKIKANHAKSMLMFIQNYYKNPVTVMDVIEYVNLERSYGSKLFKKETGFSIGEMLKEMRLRQADKYLAEGFSIKETAFSSGYRSYENFLKVFKQEKGITPTEYVEGLNSKKPSP